MPWRHPVAREPLVAAAIAAGIGAFVAFFGPPGTDFAAHVYQLALFLRHGFTLWNDLWYAGRYSFVGYSVLYYPLAAVLGIRVLAVVTAAVGAFAFAVVLSREWGPTVRWSSRSFAVIWAGFILTGAFPFALGAALALIALVQLQAGRRWSFAALAVLTLAADPVALVLLIVVLAGVALARRGSLGESVVPALGLAAAVVIELVLLRLFPGGNRFPFAASEGAAAVGFCLVGLACTWRVESARLLRYFFAVYAVAIVGVYLVPSGLGENIIRLRYIAVPLVVLVLALRRWRPLPLALAVLTLALAWNVTPLAAGWATADTNAASHASAWRAPLQYLRAHLQPSYRVEAVDTADHWPDYYLPEAGIPLVRGWFRQDDFPLDALLYRRFTPPAYLRWLHELGVAYVVMTRAPLDVSSYREARLIRSGRLGLRRVFATREISIYSVPHPRPIVTGPGHPDLLSLGGSRLVVRVSRRGAYRVAVRWSAYWHASAGCLTRTPDGMLRLYTGGPATVRIGFDVDSAALLDAFAGTAPTCVH
jgi:hypothetical protein